MFKLFVPLILLVQSYRRIRTTIAVAAEIIVECQIFIDQSSPLVTSFVETNRFNPFLVHMKPLSDRSENTLLVQ